VGNEATSSTDPSGLAKLPRGVLEVVNVGDVYEMVLKNGKRLKIRNGRFIDSCVTVNMLDELTGVSKDTIKYLKHLEDTSGVALSIRYNAFGIVMVIPGYEAFQEGRISDGCRNTAWGWIPHTWFSYAITGFWSGLYEWEKSEGDAFAERVREKYGTKH
jgi:hypothetical protein